MIGRACPGGQGFIGDVARNARLDLYLNYFLGTTDTAAVVQLGHALQGEPNGGILRIDSVNQSFFPWKGYDPELTGNVLSADPAHTGCYCTCTSNANPACAGATDPKNNKTWNVAGYCGSNNSTLARPAYYVGDLCAPGFFDRSRSPAWRQRCRSARTWKRIKRRADGRSEFFRNVRP